METEIEGLKFEVGFVKTANEQLQARIKQYEKLLQEALDLHFEFSNKDDFDRWVSKTKQALKENS